MKSSICLTFYRLAILLLCFAAGAEERPRNVILLIGDGMGVAQLTAARIAAGELAVKRCPVAGLMATHASNRLVTDSAAAATALACGVRTANGMIGMAADRRSVPNLFEVAKQTGRATGVVATYAVTHATPAGFTAHVPSRTQQAEIARQQAIGETDVLFGGGLGWFLPSSTAGSLRADDQDLLARLRQRMTVALTPEEFHAIGEVASAAALLSPDAMPPVEQREVTLAHMTAKALEVLARHEGGFVLMVEGSHIDGAGHRNDGPGIIAETLDFDRAVAVCLDLAEKRGDTLVIITADHETGAASILKGSLEKREVEIHFASGGHSAVWVPVFAYGPGAADFGGLLDNDEVGKRLMLQLKPVP